MQIEKTWARLAALVVAGVLVVGGGWLLMGSGVYGLALFVVIPIILGGLAECFRRAATWGGAAKIGALAVLVANVALLALGREGLICIAMSIPLTVPLGALGGCFTYAAGRSHVLGNGTSALLLLLPLSAGSLGFDLTAKPPVFEVRTSIEIAAAPEQVWKHVVSFSEMPPPEEWFFKAGVAYPERVGIAGSGGGAVRYCEFSTGPFVEPIKIWDEPRLLQFSVTESPASMREWSPYARVAPKHLHGYLISKQGQFRLTPLANGHTLLEGTSWYQHGLWPSQYWRVWSDAIIHRIHLRVLTHIRTLAERDGMTVR
jgi:Polyketide cyclase / dehydrase and lipid transport